MPLVQLNKEPTTRQLKQFGLISLLALPGVAWLWTQNATLVLWCTGIGGILAMIAFAAPKLLKPLFVLLTILAFPIGLVVSELVLIVVYCTALVPIGVLMRMIGKDVLNRRIDDQVTTYWVKCRRSGDVRRYYRQF